MIPRFDMLLKCLLFISLVQSSCGFFALIGQLLELGLTIHQMKSAKDNPSKPNPLKGFECLAVYAPISCGTEEGGVVVQLIDEDDYPDHDLLDQYSFSTAHGAAVLSGCANDPGDGKIEPELVICHTCKGPQVKCFRLPIPRDVVTKFESGQLKYYKFNKTIDLQADRKDEGDFPHANGT